ncbi:reverse transcriptase domain-containing protein [Tanacetum coccineum]
MKPPRFATRCAGQSPHDDVEINLRCSAVLLNKLPLKEKDPTSFTIPCQVLEKHKETEDLAADHSSRLENLHMEVLTKREIADKFSDEHLMALKSKSNNNEPWYADFVNYIVGKKYNERCAARSETLKILAHCHSGPIGGHDSANVTAKKIYESEFCWPSVYKEANEYVRRCDACQRSGNISSRNEMPQNNIQVCEVFDVWGLDFMGPFPQSRALISDRGTQFCNSQLEKALQRYGVTHKLSTTYHPQYNGQTEVTNRAIKRNLERSVGAPCAIKGVLRIQQYLQHEHYALWEVIEFGDSYKAPPEETGKGVTSEELWEAILKTFGGNEATKKTKKKKIQEQLDAHVARELEMEFAREEQLIKDQGEKDAEIARAQAEKELGMMIAELNRSNELIAKYMTWYKQAEANLPLEEKMELITELIKYQRNLVEIKKYQAQQSKPSTKTEKRNFYMAVPKSHAGWKSKDFRGMTFEQIEEKFIPVWKQLQDFMHMNFEIESERVKRPGIQLAQESSKRLKTTKASGSEPYQEHQTKDSKELSEEELKKMMEIVPVEEVYIEALQANCNTPKLGHIGIRARGVLLHRSITQDVYRTTKKSFKTDTLELTKYLLHKPKLHLSTCSKYKDF